jgi:hypothetical protein
MDKRKDFDNILNECLDRVMRGHDIHTVLALYPDYAAELEPLLKTALETRHAADVKPRPEFRQRAAYEFQSAIREMPPQKARSPFFKWQVRWVAPVAAVLVLLLAGGGTVAAASNSLPDSPLYGVKLATESVRLAFARSDLAKAELYAQFAGERVDEIIKMAEKGNTELVEKATRRMDDQLMAMVNLTSPAEENLLTADSMFQQAPSVTMTPGASTIVPPATSPVPASSPEPTLATKATATENGTRWYEYSGLESTGNDNEITEEPNEYVKVMNELIQKLEENIRALEEQLEKAPEALKPALQHALDVLRASYEEALQNLAAAG